MTNRIAVIAAHPDDEVLGCGGTMARHVREGDRVDVLILAEGLTSRDDTRDAAARLDDLAALKLAARAANAALGVTDLEFAGFPDNRLDGVDLLDVVKAVEAFLATRQPSVVYTHHPSDLNVDHRIVSQAVATACRPMPGAAVRTVLFFEVPSSTEWQPPGGSGPFVPAWFVDIGATLSQKLLALGHYAGEMRDWPHARSLRAVEALAHWRGATIGSEAAEAFAVGRHLIIGDRNP
jgi:LmbE family N-acetylglucosaminyl deacetylase